MSKQHTVVRVTKYNLEEPAAAVEVAQAPVPEPGQGQVLIRLQLRPVDPADIFSVQGVQGGARVQGWWHWELGVAVPAALSPLPPP